MINEETGLPEPGRLISVQFYLKNDRTDELIELDSVGPDLGIENVICSRKKLEFGHYFVD